MESSNAEDFVRNLPDIWYKDAFGKETKEQQRSIWKSPVGLFVGVFLSGLFMVLYIN